MINVAGYPEKKKKTSGLAWSKFTEIPISKKDDFWFLPHVAQKTSSFAKEAVDLIFPPNFQTCQIINIVTYAFKNSIVTGVFILQQTLLMILLGSLEKSTFELRFTNHQS